jgi:hypothetical protein
LIYFAYYPFGHRIKAAFFSAAFVISRANAVFMILSIILNKKIGRKPSDFDFWALVLLGLSNTKIFAIWNLSGKYAALKLLMISFASTPYKNFPYAFKRPIGILFSPGAF